MESENLQLKQKLIDSQDLIRYQEDRLAGLQASIM